MGLARLDCGIVMCDEGKEGKDGFEFYVLFQEWNRGERICSEDRKRMFKMGHGSFEVPEILGSVSSWKLGLRVQKKGQDNKELFKNFRF